MRDIFSEIFENQPLDPREAARRSTRPQLRKQFFQKAHVGEAAGGGHPLLLDGKPVKTPARRALVAPAAALAEKIAEEWNAQTEVIDPARMPLTRLANAVLDAVTDAMGPVAEEVARYLGSDLLCYRAEAPEGLVERQTRVWDPVLAWARETMGARFVLAQGVMHVAQPEATIAGFARKNSRRSMAARARFDDHHAHRIGPAGAGAWPTMRSMRRPSGPPRMWTRIGRCRNGGATTPRSSGAPIVRLSFFRCGGRPVLRLTNCLLWQIWLKAACEQHLTVRAS